MSAYRGIALGLALLTVGVGAVLFGVSAWHGRPVGVLLGALFLVAGAGRLYILGRGR
jgi:hypothetical protein